MSEGCLRPPSGSATGITHEVQGGPKKPRTELDFGSNFSVVRDTQKSCIIKLFYWCFGESTFLQNEFIWDIKKTTVL